MHEPRTTAYQRAAARALKGMTGFLLLSGVQTVVLIALCWRKDRFGRH